MIFKKSLNSRLSSFINNVDENILKKFIIGFFQISGYPTSKIDDLDIAFIDREKVKIEVLNFLESLSSLEDEVLKNTATEEMASFLTYVAHMYMSTMMIEDSLVFYEESIKIREKYLQVNSLETANNYQSIGNVYEQSGAFTLALGYYKKTLKIRKELSYVENNLLIAESYTQLALVYYHLEQYNISLDYIDESIRIREKLLPFHHTLLQSSYYNYKLILKETQPKKDYFQLILKLISDAFGAFIGRLVR